MTFYAESMGWRPHSADDLLPYDQSTRSTGKEPVDLHVFKNDQQLGPYSVEQIQSLLQDGTLAIGDLAWMEGSQSFVPVENVSELMTGSPTTPELRS